MIIRIAYVTCFLLGNTHTPPAVKFRGFTLPLHIHKAAFPIIHRFFLLSRASYVYEI